MFHLQSPQKLLMLEKSLRMALPESLKVYGTIFHMNQGNPFKLKALVDSWPNFNTLVVRPQEQEMTDDLDHYTNTYLIYSKDLKKCQEFLGSPEVINWKQHLQIQSTQSSLHEVIENLASIHYGQVKHTQCNLYMPLDTAKKLVPTLVDTNNLSSNANKPKSLNQEMFKLSSLDVAHAALVNKFWSFGGNERSQRFIERCIRTFPSFCLLGPEKTPVSWTLMDYTGELRMGATVPKYRGQALIYHVSHCQIQSLGKLGFPMYGHVDRANHSMQRSVTRLLWVSLPCQWNQWNSMPV
ncbi:glycine N-acyltransferase-like protein Keg1 [Cavia porcellus]|uniref:Glycine N-acyltransferase-like protein n=1 Tax=Cavia porcellus TaxID=10141 RepID=A0A286X807_CAVPO|nr:glycine N-acyltransferase-like protein Keg1 [Cavia porcellus]XP_013001910.1 glycine N-acyltransferase-like protein Keg1 [Cavia porcellus]